MGTCHEPLSSEARPLFSTTLLLLVIGKSVHEFVAPALPHRRNCEQLKEQKRRQNNSSHTRAMLMGSDAWSIAATWRLLYFGMLAIGMILPLLLLSQVHAGIGVRAVAGVIGGGNQPMFTSSFLVRFRQGVDNEFAHEVAAKYGFDNLGPVSKPPLPPPRIAY